MLKKEILMKLNEIFIDIFDDPNLQINSNTSAEDIEDWDSLEHINLIWAIERKFKIKFEIEEINQFQNVGQMVDSIAARVEEKK